MTREKDVIRCAECLASVPSDSDPGIVMCHRIAPVMYAPDRGRLMGADINGFCLEAVPREPGTCLTCCYFVDGEPPDGDDRGFSWCHLEPRVALKSRAEGCRHWWPAKLEGGA